MKSFKKRDKFGILWAALVAMYLVLETFAGRVEGYFFPVTRDTILISSTESPPPPFRNIWIAESYKIRGKCDYKGIEWSLGSINGRNTPVTAFFEDKPAVNGKGALEWTSLIIYLSPEETRENSFSYVYHQCPWRPWVTRTVFYNSAEFQPTSDPGN